MKRALVYGVLASFFFAFTFVFNRSMNLSGGDWMWSAALRFLFMLPMLALILRRGGRMHPFAQFSPPWSQSNSAR